MSMAEVAQRREGREMNKPTTPRPWWAPWSFGKRSTAPDTDYADMGTAFGLDASMPTLPMEDEPARFPPAKPPEGGSAR